MKGIGFLMMGVAGLFSIMAGMMGGFVSFNHSAGVAASNYGASKGLSLNESQSLAGQCAGMMRDYGVNLTQSQINSMTSMMQNGGMTSMMQNAGYGMMG